MRVRGFEEVRYIIGQINLFALLAFDARQLIVTRTRGREEEEGVEIDRADVTPFGKRGRFGRGRLGLEVLEHAAVEIDVNASKFVVVD